MIDDLRDAMLTVSFFFNSNSDYGEYKVSQGVVCLMLLYLYTIKVITKVKIKQHAMFTNNNTLRKNLVVNT